MLETLLKRHAELMLALCVLAAIIPAAAVAQTDQEKLVAAARKK